LKAIKYIISFCILFIGMLIIGESHIFRLNDFYTGFNNTTLYKQSHTTDEEMISDILHSARKNEVEVFTFKRTLRNTFLTEYEIYGTSNVETYINKELNIREEKYKSLFLGDVHFTFHRIEDVRQMDNIHDFYVIGENVKSFKIDLIEKYAGNHPREGYESNDVRNTIISIWLLIIIIVLLLSFYDVMVQKKESLIRVSMGETIHKIFWKNVLLDSVVFTSMFGTILYVLSMYTHVFFQFDISARFFASLLIVNGLLYLSLYFYNMKEVFSNSKGSKKLLMLNYGLKVVTTVLTIFIISSNIAMIIESYKLYKQKDFFEEHKDYYYIRLNYKITEERMRTSFDTLGESTKIQTAFYKGFMDKFNAISLVRIDSIENGVIVNKNAYPYLSSKIPEMNNVNLTKSFYFMLPEKMKDNHTIIGQLKGTLLSLEGENDYEIIYYKEDVETISIDENYVYGSKIVNNPVIIYNNLSSDMVEGQSSNNKKQAYLSEIMYKVGSDEFNQFVEKNELTDEIVTKTNVLENYNNKWMLASSVLYMNAIFSFLVILLEVIIISSIIKLEYEVNAIELAIKKVLGYSVVENHQKLIFITLIMSLISIVSAVIIAYILKLDEVPHLIAGGLIILVVELFLTSFYIRKMEKAKIQQILKGGNV
jgi:putative ABC transport system permease protein